MIDNRNAIIEKIFASQNESGFWQLIPETHRYYPDCLHYIPNYKASLWTLILLAELQCNADDSRVRKPLQEIKNHLFDEQHGIYSLKENHFPIPCLNGNMLFLDCYFNGKPGEKSKRLLEFFCRNQRFDDGKYEDLRNQFCSNTSCYGKHTCYWGVVKLLKGISFLPDNHRNEEVIKLRDKCINFILKHKVCYSSRHTSVIMINKIDLLTFPNFYKSDFLEILWVLAREKIISKDIKPALDILKSKQRSDGMWELEREVKNMVASIGKINQANHFITDRANEVIEYYENHNLGLKMEA